MQRTPGWEICVVHKPEKFQILIWYSQYTKLPGFPSSANAKWYYVNKSYAQINNIGNTYLERPDYASILSYITSHVNP